MTRVLFIGIEPDAVDFSDPDLPPGANAKMIADGIEVALAKMRERGWDADFCSIQPDDTAAATVAAALADQPCDCVVIGGGIRVPKSNLRLFEQVVNAVGTATPGTPIAFNTSPPDTPDAAARWVGG